MDDDHDVGCLPEGIPPIHIQQWEKWPWAPSSPPPPPPFTIGHQWQLFVWVWESKRKSSQRRGEDGEATAMKVNKMTLI